MDPEIKTKLDEQNAKIEEILVSVRKMRRNSMITTWATILFVVLPAIGLAFVLPSFIDKYVSSLGIQLGQ